MSGKAATHMLLAYTNFKGSLKKIQDKGLQSVFENVLAADILKIYDTTSGSKSWHEIFNLMSKVRFLFMDPLQMSPCFCMTIDNY